MPDNPKIPLRSHLRLCLPPLMLLVHACHPVRRKYRLQPAANLVHGLRPTRRLVAKIVPTHRTALSTGARQLGVTVSTCVDNILSSVLGALQGERGGVVG